MTGLSTAHIPPAIKKKSPEFSYWDGGGLIEAKLSGWKIPQKGGGKRGAVRLFSRQSRKRLLNLMGMIKRVEKPIFVTLTYPLEFSNESSDWKIDLEKFHKRMLRKFEKVSMVWKLEPQRRGAPHYHILVWGVGYANLRNYTSKCWYEAVGSGDLKHLAAGVRVEKIRDWNGMMSYASKYLGKVLDEEKLKVLGWDRPGRFWGVKGRKFLPVAIKKSVVLLGDEEVYDLFRLMRRFAGIKARQYRSLTMLTRNPNRWAEVLAKDGH